MPIYEYRCSSCGHEKEVLQKLSDPPLAECPACGKSTLRKLVSAAGFHLKGSGWYATDFKNKSSKPAEKKSEEKKSDDKPESKSDAKPEKKTESKSEASA
jgi:putative FmdB family regulatory protein